MWPDGVVVVAPLLDQHLGLLECVEDFTVEQLISELAVEALVKAVLPGARGLDVECLYTYPLQPLPDGLGGELWAVVRADVIGWAVLDKEIGQDLQNVIRPEAARHFDGQAPPSELIDHGQHAKGPAIVCASLHEVIGPDVVLPRGSEADARSIIQIEPASFGLLGRDF